MRWRAECPNVAGLRVARSCCLGASCTATPRRRTLDAPAAAGRAGTRRRALPLAAQPSCLLARGGPGEQGLARDVPHARHAVGCTRSGGRGREVSGSGRRGRARPPEGCRLGSWRSAAPPRAHPGEPAHAGAPVMACRPRATSGVPGPASNTGSRTCAAAPAGFRRSGRQGLVKEAPPPASPCSMQLGPWRAQPRLGHQNPRACAHVGCHRRDAGAVQVALGLLPGGGWDAGGQACGRVWPLQRCVRPAARVRTAGSERGGWAGSPPHGQAAGSSPRQALTCGPQPAPPLAPTAAAMPPPPLAAAWPLSTGSYTCSATGLFCTCGACWHQQAGAEGGAEAGGVTTAQQRGSPGRRRARRREGGAAEGCATHGLHPALDALCTRLAAVGVQPRQAAGASAGPGRGSHGCTAEALLRLSVPV